MQACAFIFSEKVMWTTEVSKTERQNPMKASLDNLLRPSLST